MATEWGTGLCLLALLAVAPGQQALAQPSGLQGAWIEDGGSCAGVFVNTGKAIAFKRPASPFSAAFIVSGKRLSTPTATCRILGARSTAGRDIMKLSCTTSISTGAVEVYFALAADGGLSRYTAADGGYATRYRRCGPDDLKNGDRQGAL